MELAGRLGMDRTCGAASAEKRKEGTWRTVPQDGGSVEGPRRWRGCTTERERRVKHRDDRIQLRVDRAAGAALIETREMEEKRPGGP